MGGSSMSGNSTWAIVGPIVAVVGMLIVLFSLRRRDRQTPTGFPRSRSKHGHASNPTHHDRTYVPS